jgi:archaellum component FlaF (FlaF/FlaG flagellin family)
MSPKPLFLTHSRIGLSEVVAAAILTLASLVAIAVAFATGMLRVAPAATSTGLLVSAHLEPFGGGGLLEVTVYNVGKEPVTLTQLRMLSGSSLIWSASVNQNLKPSTGFSNTYVISSGLASGGVYIVEARANTQRTPLTTIIASTEVVMR